MRYCQLLHSDNYLLKRLSGEMAVSYLFTSLFLHWRLHCQCKSLCLSHVSLAYVLL
jgi:hypothetical protein